MPELMEPPKKEKFSFPGLMEPTPKMPPGAKPAKAPAKVAPAPESAPTAASAPKPKGKGRKII